MLVVITTIINLVLVGLPNIWCTCITTHVKTQSGIRSPHQTPTSESDQLNSCSIKYFVVNACYVINSPPTTSTCCHVTCMCLHAGRSEFQHNYISDSVMQHPLLPESKKAIILIFMWSLGMRLRGFRSSINNFFGADPFHYFLCVYSSCLECCNSQN